MMKKQEKLLSGFLTPHQDYRPATMWFWNDELKEAEITAQLEAFRDKGINDFFVNATWGATDEYLGERYFEAIKHTVKEAERLGLSFWIYDEFNWPSGVAGGQLLRDHPETRAKVLKDTKWSLSAGGTVREQYIKGSFEGAQMVYRDCPEDGAVDVSDQVQIEENAHGFWISYQNDSCADVVLHVMSAHLQETVTPAAMWGKYSFNQEGYVDALDKDAMRAFLDSTHEKYKAKIGEAFGKTVKGLFTDEVCVGAPHDMGLSRVPWNDAMREKFRNRFGYDMAPWLHALVEKPTNAQEKKVRYQFWQLLTELVRDAHIKQAYEWCEKENLIYTGHFDGEESLTWSMYQSGDIFELMKWMHIPGIDSILSRDRIEDENFDVAGKVVSSCARFYDRPRILCETFTMSSSRLRFDEMRRVANRLMVLGVNMIQYMGVHYSMDNGRGEFVGMNGGPSHGDHNTLFSRYDLFGDYVARVQYLSAQTAPAGRVLVLWAQAATYVNANGHCAIFKAFYDPDQEPDVGYLERTMIGTVNALLELNIEYDLFGDSMADEVQATDGKVQFFGGEYDAVILPDTADTTSGVMRMVERLKSAGVKMVFIDELPQLAVDEAKKEAPFGATPLENGLVHIEKQVEFLRTAVDDKRRGQNEYFKKLLIEALGDHMRTLDIWHDGNIYTGLRRGEDTTVVFLCNDANEDRHATIAYCPGMQLMDPDTGKKVEMSPAGGRAKIHFDPYQMYVLIQSEEPIDLPKEDACETEAFLELQPSCELEMQGGNILSANWKYAPYRDNGQSITVPEEQLTWIPDMMVPGKYANKCQQGLLVYDFQAKYLPEEVMLYIETAGILRCELNGVRIDDQWNPCRWWGVHNASMEVAKLLKNGTNRLAVVFAMPDYNTPYLVGVAMLRGDFETVGDRIVGKRPSYLAEPVNGQGYPRFAGDAVYRFKVTLTEEEAREAAYLSLYTREACELVVNGQSAGVRLWAPQHFRTEGMFQAGENEVVVRVTLPMWNMICKPNEGMNVGLLQPPCLEHKK